MPVDAVVRSADFIRRGRVVIGASLVTLMLVAPARAQCPNLDAATSFTAGTGPSSVAIGDFNGDGQNDLAVANRDSSNVSILLATGPGTFGPATSVAAGTESRFVAIGNFNGDALSDLAVANRISDNVSILLATGPGTFYESDCQGRSSSLLKAFRSLWQSALTVVVTTNVSA